MGVGLWLGGHSAISMLQVLHICVFQYIGLRVLGARFLKVCRYDQLCRNSCYAGLPNRSDFCGKGPDADLFALRGPENGPEITKRVRISE